MAIENLETRPADFEHTLAILPHGDRWYVYIDEPKQWWRVYDSLDLAAVGVASTLERLLIHEQGQKIKYARHPLANNGAGTFPAQEPRWRVRVTADCGEEQAEWQIEMLDNSAWFVSGYDLSECLHKLGRRLVVNSVPTATVTDVASKTTGIAATILPQQAKPAGIEITAALGANVPQKWPSLPPPDSNTVTTPANPKTVLPVGSIEDVMTARLEALGSEISEQEHRLREVKAETEKRLVELRREQRALSAARSAYRDKIRTHEKPAG